MSRDGRPSRRVFLRALLGGTAAGLSLARRSLADAPAAPKEGGLASEGLLAGQPGFHSRVAAPLPHEELPGFLSRAQLAAHHAAYVQTVETLRTAEQSLTGVARDAGAVAAYAALRRQQVAAANDVLLHDFYFGGLAPAPLDMPPYVRRHMDEHMGSPDRWAADFTLCALAARSWAALVYDPYDDRWHNTLMDSAVDGAWIGANPLVVCDVADHAYAADYRSREAYVAAFLQHIDWDTVARRYRRVDRM